MNRFLKTAALACMTLWVSAAFAENITGKWTGRVEVTVPKLPDNMSAEQKKMVENQLKQVRAVRITMTVNANKTYTSTATGGMLPKPQTSSGTWTQSGRTLTMTTTKNDGKDVPAAQRRPITLTLSADGKTMTAVLPGGGPQGSARMVFTR